MNSKGRPSYGGKGLKTLRIYDNNDSNDNNGASSTPPEIEQEAEYQQRLIVEWQTRQSITEGRTEHETGQ